MKIEFTTDGAAFCNPFTEEPDPDYEALEIAEVLGQIKHKILSREREGKILDINGNEIGYWEI